MARWESGAPKTVLTELSARRKHDRRQIVRRMPRSNFALRRAFPSAQRKVKGNVSEQIIETTQRRTHPL